MEYYPVHWIWFGVSLLLLACEVLTLTLILLGLSLGAAFTGLFLMVFPDIGTAFQLTLFGLSSGFFIFMLRIFKPFLSKKAQPLAKQDVNHVEKRLKGRLCLVVTVFEKGYGRVEVDQVQWNAKLDPEITEHHYNPKIGDKMVITAMQNMSLVVKPNEQENG